MGRLTRVLISILVAALLVWALDSADLLLAFLGEFRGLLPVAVAEPGLAVGRSETPGPTAALDEGAPDALSSSEARPGEAGDQASRSGDGQASEEAGEQSGIPSQSGIDLELEVNLEEYLRDWAGQYGLAIKDLGSGQMVLINAERLFPSASTYKLLVMYRVYSLAQSGELDLDEVLTITEQDAGEVEPDEGLFPGNSVTVSEALEAMITVSSNAAAYALARRVGGWSTVTAAAPELGMDDTGMGEDYFQTTPGDMLIFLDTLAAGRLVTPAASRDMLNLLERQTINDRIPALLPAEAVAAHKTGDLAGVRNDVGIVKGPGGSYIICAFSSSADEGEAINVIAQVARRAYDRYAR